MNRLSGNKLVLLAILGIILLLGLLATYILQDLAEPQAVTLEVLTGQFKRSNQTVYPKIVLESPYSKGEISATLRFMMGTYVHGVWED